MAELTPLVKAWISYAEHDWKDSQILSEAGGNWRSICFHLQQCIEKLFKAELMRLQLPVPKIHNLRELSDLLGQADDCWSAESIDLNRLSLAAVDFRYPDPNEPDPEIDLSLILEISAELRKKLLDRLLDGVSG
ncbi:HEPN domain-containing protein [Cyanobium sp. HWJ4-Hawea]|uniref:HEPN domain-containing protein n=1 Tax=Cyanobium sp. HWJ4-Hawea TaxID=2823713 RepID=UPI0020CC4E1C|nr:HEPN domain-containing protein [Cyanobium sp. HWJ4-Hawea]MCP9808050.1 HEPN domain-containing protein [Cyanobium sp. HWJ4-Hawea]